ncbi:glycosyltransferase N-terminal domain-containing protein [Helicobacter bilis]|uniref:glycosyltransferase N-terminal domain-containing protein n=1 Tax=Helicobacter bilis TaxID=37372 RepID=UPI00248DD583|nr:glycosyltransferase N-terminal domain-containing protein [Helicobacter bilis]
MTFIYYTLLCFLHVLALPLLCVLSLREKYKKSIPLRFLIPKNHSKESYDIWLHACSVGEVQSLQTLIESIPKTQSIFLSVITQTGYKQAQNLYAKYENLSIDYLPFETFIPLFAPTCKKLFVFEAELWLMLFVYAKHKGATTKLVNARISTRSVKRYQKLRIFYRHFFSFVDSVLSQSDEDTERLKSLGAKNVKTIGNLKLLNPIKPKIAYKKPESLIIVAASTHANEEEFVLNAWSNAKALWESDSEVLENMESKPCHIKQSEMSKNTESKKDFSPFLETQNDKNLDSIKFAPLHPAPTQMVENLDSINNHNKEYECKTHLHNATKDYTTIKKDSKKNLLVIVPRHPERFQSVFQLCKQYGKTMCLSELQNDSTLDLDLIHADILLVDTMGSLINFYAISDIVILGGAFAKVGGHNPLEPATFANVLISGTEIFNQKALFAYIQNYYLIDNSHSLQMLLHHYKQLMTSSVNKDLCHNMIESILE